MKIEETKKITTDAKVVKDIICDCCGRSCLKKMSDQNGENDSSYMDSGEFVYLDLSVNWGYYSDHDLETWSAQVCEDCVTGKLKEIIKFKIKKTYDV